jgi:hypothetical protein
LLTEKFVNSKVYVGNVIRSTDIKEERDDLEKRSKVLKWLFVSKSNPPVCPVLMAPIALTYPVLR